jgi:sugar lactone lactonase YvrE
VSRRDLFVVSAQAAAVLALARCGGGAVSSLTTNPNPGSTPADAPAYAVEDAVHAVDAGGSDYALESTLHTITRVNADGTVDWQQVGGPLNGPAQASFDSEGNVYVANVGGSDVPVFDADGRHVRTIGGYGADAGLFNEPLDVLVDDRDRLFVCDTLNHRVQVLDTQGRPQGSIGAPGTEPGRLNGPKALAIDPEGYLHVVDGGNARVQIFDAGGRYVGEYGTHGTGDGQFIMPRDIVVDAYGRCYVVDVGRAEILVFERSGAEGGKVFRPELDGERVMPLRVSLDARGELVVTGYPIPI